jgi:FkbM family methyltransferase
MFEPYIKPHGIGDLQFLYATEQAREWYDPLKPYTRLEYEWVINNVDICRSKVLDVGCHHGNYSVVFNKAIDMICIDAHGPNCEITQKNLILNEIHRAQVFNAAVSDHQGTVLFEGGANGHISSQGVEVKCYPLEYLMLDVTVVKMDIEGGEFVSLPASVDCMPFVHTWIIEIHPNAGDPDSLAQLFLEYDYELLKVYRENLTVQPYSIGEPWPTHATLIARLK